MPRGTTTDPTLLDLTAREVIWLLCRCSRRVSITPERLVGSSGVTKFTRIFDLKPRYRCKACRRRPKTLWIEKWKD